MLNSSLKACCCIALLAIAAVSCKTKKTAALPETRQVKQENTAVKTLVSKVNANANTFGYYSARGTAQYKDKEQEADLSVSIVMEKDEYIWMSVTALLGIEVARIMINRDSMVVLDRLHHRAIIARYDYIRRYMNADVSLQNLQNLLAGNAAFAFEADKAIPDTVLANILLTQPLGQRQSVSTSFSKETLKAVRNMIVEKSSGREMSVDYSEPHIYQDNAFPTGININIRAEKNVQCAFHLGNFAFEKKKDVAFSIPQSYEIVRP